MINVVSKWLNEAQHNVIVANVEIFSPTVIAEDHDGNPLPAQPAYWLDNTYWDNHEGRLYERVENDGLGRIHLRIGDTTTVRVQTTEDYTDIITEDRVTVDRTGEQRIFEAEESVYGSKFSEGNKKEPFILYDVNKKPLVRVTHVTLPGTL